MSPEAPNLRVIYLAIETREDTWGRGKRRNE